MRRLFLGMVVAMTMAVAPARAQVLTPTGVGGCVFMGITREMRLAVMGAYGASGAGAIARTPGIRSAVIEPGRRCSGGRNIGANDALLVAFTSTVMRSVEALELSNAGIGQAGLDAAWTQAHDAERAPFLARAQAYFDDAAPPEIDPDEVEAFVTRLDLSAPPTTEVRRHLLRYYEALALNALAESRLAVETPTSS